MLYVVEWPCCHDPLRLSLCFDDLLRPRNNPPSEQGPASGARACAGRGTSWCRGGPATGHLGAVLATFQRGSSAATFQGRTMPGPRAVKVALKMLLSDGKGGKKKGRGNAK